MYYGCACLDDQNTTSPSTSVFLGGEKRPLQITLSVRPPDIRDRSEPSARWSTSFVLGRTSEVKQNEQCVETHFFCSFHF